MDALIEKVGVKIKLSSLGILVTDFVDSSPEMSINKKTVTNRSGYIFNKAVFLKKDITIKGYFKVKNAEDFEEKKDEINDLLSNDEPFFITKMYPISDVYEFELPGQKANFDFLLIPHEEYKYRYKVNIENSIDYDFVGKYSDGLIAKISINLETAEMPFGQTKPIDEKISDGYISYQGTAKCSQLECPWGLKLVSTEFQTGIFNLKVGSRNFTYSSQTPIKVGDTFLLKGIETTLNDENVNIKTNYEHFILEKVSNNKVPISTNFKGTIEILNKIEFYK